MSEITIREYLEQRLDYERTLVKHQLDATREVVEQRLDTMDHALVLQRDLDREKVAIQAAEYERRLTVLNHAHEEAVRERNRVLPREMFDQWVTDFSKWRDAVNKSLSDMTSLAERIAGVDSRSAASTREYDSFKLEMARVVAATEAATSARITVMGVVFTVISIVVAIVAIFWK